MCVKSFPKFVNTTKNIPCFHFFNVFAPLNDVPGYIAMALKNNPNILNFFYEDDNQLQIQVLPGLLLLAKMLMLGLRLAYILL